MSLNDLRYLEVPLSDHLDEEDQINLLRHRSSLLWNRIVGVGICLTVLGAVAIAVIFYTERHWITDDDHHSHSDDDVVEATCYLPPSCTQLQSTYDKMTGFTNLTGWYDTQAYAGCCDICQKLGLTRASDSTGTSSGGSSRGGSGEGAVVHIVVVVVDIVVFEPPVR